MVSNEVTAANRVAERAREEQFRFECKVAVLDQKAKAATVFAKEVEDKLAEEREVNVRKLLGLAKERENIVRTERAAQQQCSKLVNEL